MYLYQISHIYLVDVESSTQKGKKKKKVLGPAGYFYHRELPPYETTADADRHIVITLDL